MTSNLVLGAIIPEVLRSDNFNIWSIYMKNYLLAQGLWDIVEPPIGPPTYEEFQAWPKKNAAVLHAIQISCEPNILHLIRYISSARVACDTLADALQFGHNLNYVPQVFRNLGSDYNYHQFLPLHNAINKGDWDCVKNLLRHHPNAINARISPANSTILHAATDTGQLKIVEGLVELMSRYDLELQDVGGYTALTKAARYGLTKIVKCMVTKNENLVRITNNEGNLPVVVACISNYKDTTCYLYSITPFELLLPENGTQGSNLLKISIIGKMFDIALDLLKRCPRLSTSRDSIGSTPVMTISSMPSIFFSGNQLTFWQRWIYSCIHVQLPAFFSVNIPQEDQNEQMNIIVRGLLELASNLLKFSGIKQIYEMKLIHLYAVEVLRCMCQEISTLDLREQYHGGVNTAIFRAIEHGIVEFIVEITKANPYLLYLVNSNIRGIFFSATEHRQEKIFSLLYGLDTRKETLVHGVDRYQNNMLHLAGMLSPSSRLDGISGAALQMQRELQWYKEVESVVYLTDKEYVNNNGETPRQMFTENHKKLVKEGENWMKQTASSYTVVGALIITIMFAAAFTVPGSNDQATGLPIFLNKKSFMFFIISDAVSLFASSTSVLMFLGILTSRYAEEDFLKSLPTKLIIGLSTLFFSIAAMMVAFCSALYIMLDGQLRIVIPIILLACVPVTLFIFLQFPLLVKIFISTYGWSIFNRKMKPWL